MAASAMVAVSISRSPGRHAPTAFTCVPGESHSRRSTGCADVVAVTTMPAPATAPATVSWALTGRVRRAGQVGGGLAGSSRVTPGDADPGQRPGRSQGVRVRPALHAGTDDRQV